jgi:uncharacterized membrane protein YeaQ/YmgE (transglycosylase-associated protein family)
MSFLTWIVLGLLAGFFASKIVNREDPELAADIMLGVAGAIVGGWLFVLLGFSGMRGANLHSLLIAVSGAILVLFVFHLIRRAV